MDHQIKNLENITEIDKEDILVIQKKNGATLNISLDQLLTFIQDNTAAGISVYKFTDEGRNFIQSCFSANNLGTTPHQAPTSCEDILPFCEGKATMETELTLGSVRRTILFAYDSYIYYGETTFGDSDYYNYTGSVVLNDKIHYVRLQFFLDNHWTCAVSVAN